MSGIVGIVNRDGSPVDRLLLGQMTDYLAFRGPDAQETWSQGPVGLGHALLHTVDDTRADSQPLTLDGQVWIVADARVDARGELRGKLRSHGCRDLEEATDAELILQSYLVWGEECVRHLIGDFAFAIWDEPRQRLFAARDHLGVKPFYYARKGNFLIFSNTLNCLRMHPEVSDELNDLAIADFLMFGFNQDPATTSFIDIQRLPPSHSLTWQDGALQFRRYWNLPQEGPLRYRRPTEYVEHFKELLDLAVADRLRTRRVGVFLSGGLDSPIVAAAAKRLLAARGGAFDLRAYSLAYDRLIPDQERHWSSLMAQHLGIPISHLLGDDYGLYEGWEGGALPLPEPYPFPGVGIWADLTAQAASRSRVILTGDGADPLLAPSPSYVRRLFRSFQWGRLAVEMGRSLLSCRVMPRMGFRTLLRRLQSRGSHPYPPWLNPDLAARLDLPERWRRFSREPLPSHPLRPEAIGVLMNRQWQLYFEQVYDPGGSGQAVEVRFPLFDVRLVNFALALPPLPWCVDKFLMREAGRGVLPEAGRRRPKAHLAGTPEGALLRQPASRWVDHFTPAPGLARYVRRSAIPPVAGAEDEEKALDNLQPLSINIWLEESVRRGPWQRVAQKPHRGERP